MAGATFDIVVLSSSPPNHAQTSPLEFSPPSPLTRRVGMPTISPLSLSPLPSPQKKTSGALKSGSRAAAIPNEAVRGFATARSLVRSEHLSVNIEEEFGGLETALERRGSIEDVHAKKPRKRAAKASAGGDNAEKPKPKPRARKRRENADAEPTSRKPASATSSHFIQPTAVDAKQPRSELAQAAPKTKLGKPRKPRAKKADLDNDNANTTSKSRITKPRKATNSTERGRSRATKTVSAHFEDSEKQGKRIDTEVLGTTAEGDAQDALVESGTIWDVPLSPSGRRSGPPKHRPPDEKDQPLVLDEAVMRRRDWTPPRETEIQVAFLSSGGKENNPSTVGAGKGSFSSLLSGYTYAHADVSSLRRTSKPTMSEGARATKKRRVELVDVPVNQPSSRQSSPEKGKAPKKKPRTITDLVTAQYAPEVPNADPSAVTSDFFAPRSTITKVPLNDTPDAETHNAPSRPARKRSTSRSKSKNGEATSRSKKSTGKSAVKPKMIADKLLSPSSAVLKLNRQDVLFGTSSQLALEESPLMVREIQRAIVESERDATFQQRLIADAPDIKPWPRLERAKGKKSLWAACSRDENGELLEKQSEVYMPEPDRTQDFPLLMDGTHDKTDSSFVDINDFPKPLVMQLSSDLPTPPPTVSGDVAGDSPKAAIDDSPFLDIEDFPQEPPPSNQNVESSFFNIDDFPLPIQPTAVPLPQTITSCESPQKRRGRPPKNHSAIPQGLTCSAPAPEKAPSKPKPTSTKLPGTPTKKQRRFAEIEEILDSEDDEALSPTPPRTRKLEDSPPLQLFVPAPAEQNGTVSLFRIPEAQLQWANVKDSLFSRITTLIRALPPTTNPAQPSWHEKILMYDPIVLEDFTAFLNSHAAVCTYRRATQKQVKAWDKELKSKGKEKMAVEEGSGVILAVEKDLEMWMVQKWCEEMSICCISREGRGKGGVRKGLY